MNGLNLMQGWAILAGSVAMIALILTAFGLMLGIVEPADALRRLVAIVGVIILLIVTPSILVNIWSNMSSGQQICLTALVIFFGLLLRPRQKRSRRRET